MFNIQTYKVRGSPNLVKDWRRRVIAAGGGFENDSLVIASNFIRALETKSYYTKIRYLLPFLGSGINTVLVPLIDWGSLGNATNFNFVSADFNQRTGLQGDGSSKYLRMPINATQLGSSNNGGVGFWALNVSVAAGTQYALGYFTPSSTLAGLRFGNSAGDINCEFYWGTSSTQATFNELRSNSHYYGNRSASDSRILYKNGQSVATNTSADGFSGASGNSFSSYSTDISGTQAGYWGGSKGVEYYTDGTLTSAEVADFHNVLATFLMKPSGKI